MSYWDFESGMLGLQGWLDSPRRPVRPSAANLRQSPWDHGHLLSSPAYDTQDPPPTCQSRLESDSLTTHHAATGGESGFR